MKYFGHLEKPPCQAMASADHQRLFLQIQILESSPNKEEPCIATATWQDRIRLQLIAVALQDSSFRQNNYDKALIFFAPSPSIIDGTD